MLALLTTLPVFGGLFVLLDSDETEAKGRRKRRKKRHKHGRPRTHGKKKRCRPHPKSTTCAGKCGAVKNNCRKTVDCGSCDCPEPCAPCFICQSGPNTPGTCVLDPEQQGQPCGGSDGQVCQPDGVCECDASSCPNPTPICEAGVCVACSAARPCPSGCCHEATGACAMDCPRCLTCNSGLCVADPNQNREVCADSGTTSSICCNGVCCDGCCGADGSRGACLVFNTFSGSTSGNLGGLGGADAICQTRAENATPAPLPGSYSAWLSIGNGPDESPASGRFRRSGQPYRLVNGATIAANWADLTDGGLAAPISVDESGQEIGRRGTFTSTRPDGTFGNQSGSSSSCAGWLSANASHSGGVGDSDQTDADWTIAAAASCGPFGPRFLYCFQQR